MDDMQQEAWQPHLPPPAGATRSQRIALLAGVIVAAWLALRLFEPVLLPFVAAAGIAYVLDPACTRLTRARVPRSFASLLLVLGLITAMLLFVLLLYPLILDQIGLLVGRVPSYVRGLSTFAAKMIAQLQQHLGPEYVDAKLSELVSSQAGAMLEFFVDAVSRIVGGGYALFNVLSLVVVTPVVAFYLLRDWPKVVARVDSWLPRRYQGVLRAQVREVDRILSAWSARPGDVLHASGAVLCARPFHCRAGAGAGGRPDCGLSQFHPLCRHDHRGRGFDRPRVCAVPDMGGGVARRRGVRRRRQVLEGYVIYPRFLGDRVELPAVWVIFALFAGGAAFGFVGVMLAVPVAATVGVLARFWLRRYLRSPLYLDPPV